MSNRAASTVGRRKSLATKRGAKSSVAIGLSSLLFISLFFTGVGAPSAQGDQQDESKDNVAVQPTAWVESPTPTVDGTDEGVDGESAVVKTDEAPVEALVTPTETAISAKESEDVQQPAVEEPSSVATPVSSSTDDSNAEPLVVEKAEPLAVEKQELTDDLVAPMAVDSPSGNEAVITVKVGGIRTGPTTVGGLAGVELGLFTSETAGTPPVADFGTCTSGADGECSFTVPETQDRINNGSWWFPDWTSRGENWNKRFWVKQIGVSSLTHYTNGTLGTGATASSDDYQFQTGSALTAGNTYRSTSDFMISTNNNSFQASSGIWQNSLNNPPLTQKCGIDVGLVLDLSNSVTAPDLLQLKEAASGFVDALTGTPSKVGTFTFATNGPAASGHTLLPVSVSSAAGATAVKDQIDNYTLPGGNAGGTNWDRGFYQVAQADTKFDVVVIITDGNPTFYGNGEGPGSKTRFREVENGIFSTNAIKARGTRVIAFGVGQGVANPAAGLNLRAISGKTLNSDYYQTKEYEEAGNQLRELALGNCNGSVSVVKQVIPVGGTTAKASPAGGWTFTGQGATGVTITDGASRITAVDTGAANFPLVFDNVLTSGPVTLTETPKNGYRLEQVEGKNATCKRVGTGTVVTTTNVTNGFTVDANPKYPISCTVYNRTLQPAQLSLKKVVNNGDTAATYGSADWTLSALDGPTPISGPGNSTAVTNQSVGVGTYTLSESDGPDGYTASAWSCSAGTLNGSTLTLDYGDEATCTITNTAKPSKLTLVKTVTNDNGGTAALGDWTLVGAGPTPGVSGTTGSTAVSGRTVKVGTYTLSESGGPSGYTPGAWSCDGGALNGSKVTVGVGEEVTCTINNDDEPALLTLVKTITNDNRGTAAPTDWTLTAAGPVTVAGPVGDPAVTKAAVAAGEYGLSESEGPGGYTAGDWSCDGGTLTDSTVTLGVGEDVTCTLNNDDQPHIFIEKWGNDESGGQGAIGGSGFEVRPDQDGLPSDQTTAATRVGGDTGLFEAGPFEPGSYWLVETEAPSGHSLLAEPVGFTIDREGKLALVGNNPQATINPAGSLTIRITDVAAIPLPLSGGAAMNSVVLAMVVLGIGGFGVALIRRQRPQRSLTPG